MGIGILIRLTAGFHEGVIGAALMHFVDAMPCFPSIFLLLAISALIQPFVPSITTSHRKNTCISRLRAYALIDDDQVLLRQSPGRDAAGFGNL